MFYSQVILARKGPLGKIWLAAHFEKRLSKAQIFSTDISQSVENVLNPATPLALRVSGHLMLGIVRIYSKKVKYLMVDCTEAMWKMKLVFKPGKVDIDTTAAHVAIDDHRHYGHVAETTLVDLPVMLENVGFASQMLPSLSISRLGYLDDESVLTEMSEAGRQMSLLPPREREKALLAFRPSPSPLGEIEEMRAGTPRSSLSLGAAGRSPLSIEGRRPSYLGRFEEELPAFEEELVPVPILAAQELPFSPTQLPPVQEETFETTEEEATPERMREAPAMSRAALKAKRKVHFDERVELSDKQLREALSNPAVHLRRRPDDPLLLEKRSTKELALNPDFYRRDLSSELIEVMDLALGLQEMPFPTKRPRRAIEETPETVPSIPLAPSPFEIPEEQVRGKKRLSKLTPEVARLSYEPQPLEMEMPQIEAMQPFETPEVSFPAPSVEEQRELRKIEKLLSRPAKEEAFVRGEKHLPTNLRSREMLAHLQSELATKPSLSMERMLSGCSRNIICRGFLELLQLKSMDLIELNQEHPYEDIRISLPAH